MILRSTRRLAVVWVGLSACTSPRLDDTHLDETPIRIGMSGPLRGPSGDLGQEMRRGMQAALHRVNAAGGVHGRPVELLSVNDDLDPALAIQRARELLDVQRVVEAPDEPDALGSDGAFALVGSVGTPALSAASVAAKNQVVVFGTASGSRPAPNGEASSPYVYHYRASYVDEATAMIEYLRRVREPSVMADPRAAYRRILVLAQDDGYGDAGYRSVVSAYEQGAAPLPSPDAIARVGYARDDVSSVDPAVERAARLVSDVLSRSTAEREPVAIIMIDEYRAGNRFIRKLKDWVNADAARASRLDLVFLHVSSVGSDSLASALAATPESYPDATSPGASRRYTENVVVTEVVPDYRSDLPGVVRYRQDIGDFDDGPLTFTSLEGHVVTRLFVEALERNGPDLTGANLVRTLDTQIADLGLGVELGFSPTNHQASHAVWGIELGSGADFTVAFAWNPDDGFQVLDRSVSTSGRASTSEGDEEPARFVGRTVAGAAPDDLANDAAPDAGADAMDAAPDAEVAEPGSASADAGAPDTDSDTAGVCTSCVPTACTEVLADSVVEFSSLQGQAGWYYGYYESPNFGSGDFLPFAVYEYLELVDDFIWRRGDEAWTWVGASRQHPNGVFTTGGKTPIEHHSVRRWVSTTTETLFIQGTIDALRASRTGVIGRIAVGDTEVWQHFVAPGQTTAFPFQITARVETGDFVNFILEPVESDDGGDDTAFEVQLCR